MPSTRIVEDWSQVGSDKQEQIRAISQVYIQAVKQAEQEYNREELAARRERDAVYGQVSESALSVAERKYEREDHQAFWKRYQAIKAAKYKRQQALQEIGVIYREESEER